MVYLIRDAVWQTLRGAGIADYFDVAVVSVLLYLALRWMHRGRSLGVLQGILVMAVLYGLAIQTGLTLTTSLVRGVITVVTLSWVSLFQEDLRRIFERVSVRRQDPIHRRMFEALIKSVRHFSENHIGALIVLKGRDPLDRHLDGGQRLDGCISSALLESLFDPHSDGHDGAVIVAGDQIQRFGVHLPLSKHLAHDTGLGTRHAAALGLAELTDAFCLVVSETRGSVMIAREGQLLQMGSGQRLEKRLREFLRERFQVPVYARSWRLVWEHPIEKGLALVLGLALWLVFVKGIRPVERTFVAPIQVTRISRGLQVDTLYPPTATIIINGLEKDLHAFKAPPVVLEIPRMTHKLQSLTISVRDVQVPPPLSIKAISPASVILRLKPIKPASRASVPLAASRHAWFKFR